MKTGRRGGGNKMGIVQLDEGCTKAQWVFDEDSYETANIAGIDVL